MNIKKKKKKVARKQSPLPTALSVGLPRSLVGAVGGRRPCLPAQWQPQPGSWGHLMPGPFPPRWVCSPDKGSWFPEACDRAGCDLEGNTHGSRHRVDVGRAAQGPRDRNMPGANSGEEGLVPPSDGDTLRGQPTFRVTRLGGLRQHDDTYWDLSRPRDLVPLGQCFSREWGIWQRLEPCSVFTSGDRVLLASSG